MAHKKRNKDGDFDIVLTPFEMLKVERLLKRLDEVTEQDELSSDENGWLSNALDFFAAELASGRYTI